VRQFIDENLDWLVSQLNNTPLLSVIDADRVVTGPAPSVAQQQQQPSTDAERPSDDFNPLKMFAYIGSSQFNHVRTNNVIVFLAEHTPCTTVSYWHVNVVCLSVTLCILTK